MKCIYKDEWFLKNFRNRYKIKNNKCSIAEDELKKRLLINLEK